MTLGKFAAYSYGGVPHTYYIVEERVLPQSSRLLQVGHHAILLDRSKSVYVDAVARVEKVLTVEGFANAGPLVSLWSYSSHGDLTRHFVRTPVAELLRPGSTHSGSVQAIQATALTSASQAFAAALHEVQDDETTAVSLHSDGYFSVRSSPTERHPMERLVEEYHLRRNVFVNTIARHESSDFPYLSRIANALSGKCVPVESVKEVYEALHDTSALLARGTVPTAVLPRGDADYQAAVSVAQRKVNGTAAEVMLVQGIGQRDDCQVYRYRKVSPAVWNAAKIPVLGEEANEKPLYTFIRAKLSEGCLDEAKHAAIATRNGLLLDKHLRALTPENTAAFARTVDQALYEPAALMHMNFTTQYGLS